MEYKKDINERVHEYVTVVNVSNGIQSFKTNKKEKGYMLKPKEKLRISVGELLEIASTESIICGFDGYGSGATVYIEDEQLRRYFEFEKTDGDKVIKQKTFDEDFIVSILTGDSQKRFETFIDRHARDIYRRNMIYRIALKTDSMTQVRIRYIETKFRYTK